jgi:hypothetical protein
MELEAVVGYLVALSVPLWLLGELVTHPWSSGLRDKRLEPGQHAGEPIFRAPSATPRAQATNLPHPRRAAQPLSAPPSGSYLSR